jgi:hypothetical protein
MPWGWKNPDGRDQDCRASKIKLLDEAWRGAQR